MFIIIARGRNNDKQIKAEAVSLVIDNGKTIAAVARELEILKTTVGKWVENYKDNGTEAFIGSGNLSPVSQRARDLQKQLRDM